MVADTSREIKFKNISFVFSDDKLIRFNRF